MTGADRWTRLGDEVQRARLSNPRWRRRSDFAAACGLGLRTLVSIENGEPKDRHAATYAAIETALGWAAGDCERVLAGGSPTTDRALQYVINAWPRLNAQTRAIVIGFVDDALA